MLSATTFVVVQLEMIECFQLDVFIHIHTDEETSILKLNSFAKRETILETNPARLQQNEIKFLFCVLQSPIL